MSMTEASPTTTPRPKVTGPVWIDRKSTRLNSSHANISYAVFCLKKNYIVQPALASVSLVDRTLNSLLLHGRPLLVADDLDPLAALLLGAFVCILSVPVFLHAPVY